MSAVVVSAVVAERRLELELDLPAGRVLAVVGPNGAGKTSLLHLVAGLLRPSAGTVWLGGRQASTPARVEPPHRRRVALLTQRPALFPHLSVLDNVAFGPRAAGVPARVANARAADELAAVGCAEFAGRRPVELSGGQAQRVAIARALATDPDVILLDEPLAGLDVAVAPEVRHWFSVRLRDRTAILVTHDVLDIWTLADDLAVLQDGRITEAGPAATLLTRPSTRFLAQVCGRNLFTGTAVDAGSLAIAPGVVLRGVPDPDQPLAPGRAGLANVPPAAVALYLEPPGGSPRNLLTGNVRAVESRGDLVRVSVEVSGQRLEADVTGSAAADLGLRPGVEVRAAIKAAQVRLYGR